MKYFNEKGIETKEEDNGRMFLKSNKSKELLSFLLKGNEENGNTIFYNEEVTDISKENDGYSILTSSQTFLTKHIVIAS
ncbi:NAD(P)/FAD-dependent oxidoreductase [bacterium]|nr:NAD(P)/FAD-dependent oxidoreductase [bacterium]